MKKTKSTARAKRTSPPPCSAAMAAQLAAIRANGCFRCDGSKRICNVCGESGRACQCEGEDFDECPECRQPNINGQTQRPAGETP